MSGYLEQINEPNDIKKIAPEHYNELAAEIRRYLIKTVSETGGHLASNLGAVELTIALHASMNFPEDKLIWDVGHQSYVHKILTGRKEELKTIRQNGGLSGFPKEEESDCDAFDTGHSTTSIAVAAGYSRARDLKGENYKVVAVIGDGSLSGGMAYEAINNLSRFKTNTIIILNDNEMSISKNVGGMAAYLEKVRQSEAYIDFKGGVEKQLIRTEFGMKVAKGLVKTKNSIRDMFMPGDFFKDMGIGYFGPVDGHNIPALLRAIEAAKSYRGAVIVHAITKKGKGYIHAEKNPSKFHGISPFNVRTGELKCPCNEKTYTEIFGETLCEIAEKNKDIVAITAAMSDGTGLVPFHEKFPKRFFDVGIAEEYAVTFAAGLAAGGMRPVVAIYSTFLQRAYDQIIHDVCLTKKNVIFAIDRAGIVGQDGETHQGIYDDSYLATIPNLTVISPKNGEELSKALWFAADFEGPIAIRYPRGGDLSPEAACAPIEPGKAEKICEGTDIAVVSLGSMYAEAEKAVKELTEKGKSVSFYNLRFTNPIDEEMLSDLMNYKAVIVTEEAVKTGSAGERIEAILLERGFKGKIKNISLPDKFLEHGTVNYLKEKYGLTSAVIVETAEALMKGRRSTKKVQE